MPVRHEPITGVCVICERKFSPQNSRNTCCGPECIHERRLRTMKAWYAANRTAHIRRVIARRKAKIVHKIA